MNFVFYLIGLILTIVIAFSAPIAIGTPEHVVIAQNNYTLDRIKDTVNSLAQDMVGHVWIGTPRGLYRYDGTGLKKVTTEESFSFHEVYSLTLDSRNRLWVASNGSKVSKYNSLTNGFQHFDLSEYLPETTSITDIASCEDGRVWIGTKSGILLFNSDLGIVVDNKLKAENGDEIEFSYDLECIDKTGVVFLAKQGIYFAHELKNSRNISVRSAKSNNSLSPSASTYNKSTKTLWISTKEGEIYRIDDDGLPKLFSSLIKDNPGTTITNLKVSENTLYVGTDKGLYILSSDTGYFTEFNAKNSSLGNVHISSVLVTDRSVWIGTYRGLSRITRSQFEWFNSKNSRIPNEVLSFETDSSGEHWIGTFEGLYKLQTDATGKTTTHTAVHNQNRIDPRIMALAINREKLWIGTRGHGVQILDTNTGNITQLHKEQYADAAVTSILHLSPETTLVGTFNYGVLLHDGERVSPLDSYDGNGPSERSITFIQQLRKKDRVLIGSERALYLYSGRGHKMTPIIVSINNTREELTYLSIFEDSVGGIWLGTLNSGLFYSDSSLSKSNQLIFSPVTYSNVLSTSSIYGLVEDETQRLWVSSSSGIYVLDLSGNMLRRFSAGEGLQGNDFNFGAVHKAPSGHIFFGGSNGYNRLDPSTIQLSSKQAPLVLTSIQSAAQNIAVNTAAHRLESITLTHTDYYITFEFSALDFIDPGNNLYRYKLEGFDPDWIDIGNRNTATYTNLPAGDYRFRVQAANASGIWNQDGIDIALRMNPAPWYTWWAYCLYALAGAIVVWLIKKAYDNYAIRNQALKLAEEMQITADRAMDDVQEQLDEQAQLIESIHFFNLERLELLRDCLARHTDFLPPSFDEANLTSTRGRLLAMLCLERSLLYKHEQLLCNLYAYTNELTNHLLSESESGEQITVINEVPDRLVSARQALPISLVLFELIENAIQHAFASNAQGSYLVIRANYGDPLAPAPASDFEFTVADNGLGLPISMNLEAPETEGLATIAELINAMGGVISVDREQGTSFTFTIPGTGPD
ncbi:hypothetical protein FV139_16255 [Parahaliea maris]|uniref:Histidine kinase/HSP90-like ATPase domain-containing protein n=1 Tax=Parahaliea maris TaxID=2716870 RepID=A0A5C8ZS12_9GAMM|nr:triple tyrosine motif-containing protein [Parahaliea maris]TXS91288.1 hypothetical protein FV139_16255 [Parahaliea maris]